jgi:hypothetical protein
MLRQVTADHIKQVISLTSAVQKVTDSQKKKDLFAKLAVKLSEESRFALTLFVWHCRENPHWRPLDASRFYIHKPSEENKSDIFGFVRVLNYYKNQRVTLRKEKVFTDFLRSCDEAHFYFYLQIFSRRLLVGLPVQQVLEMLELGQIDPELIYGDLPLLETSFADLNYPVSIAKVTDPETTFFIYGKTTSGRNQTRIRFDGKLVGVVNSKFLKEEGKFIREPAFAIAGFLDKHAVATPGKKWRYRMYKFKRAILRPSDYFRSYGEFKRYYFRKAGEVTPFEKRIELLNQFLHDNFTTQIGSEYVGLARGPEEILDEALKVIGDESTTHLVFSDSESTRTGNWVALRVVKAEAIVENYWVDAGVVRGFTVWFNGGLYPCKFEFKGKTSAWLNDLEFVRHRPIEIMYVRLGETRVLHGLELKWNSKPWRRQPMSDGTMLEKCCLCGTQDQPHNHHGLCYPCEQNLTYYWKTYGPENWIYPRWKGQRKRAKFGWEPEILTCCDIQYHGCVIEGNAEGGWRFVPDETAKIKWEKYLRENGREDEIE